LPKIDRCHGSTTTSKPSVKVPTSNRIFNLRSVVVNDVIQCIARQVIVRWTKAAR
jgi:hypothetical protein